MATPSEQLESIRLLGENWDGYGAAAPQSRVIDFAHEFIALIEAVLRKSRFDPGTFHVSPTRVAGVLIDWQNEAMEHEVELNPDCSIGFLHLGKATGEVASR